MKQLIIFLMLVIMAFAVNAQTTISVKPYGSKAYYTLTPSNDTITIEPKYSASAYAIKADTTLYVNTDTIQATTCNTLYLKFINGNARKHYLYFKNGFSAVPTKDSIAASKIKVYYFINVSAGKFILLGKSAEY